MQKRREVFVLMVLMAMLFTGILWGQDRTRNGTMRGTFVKLKEQKIGRQVHVGIVVKPSEKEDLVTVLVPRQREELWQAAHKLQEGQPIGISFVTEEGDKWLRRMDVGRRRERIEEGPETREEVLVRREFRRDPAYIREGRSPRRPLPHLEQMQGQIREIVTGHLEHMGRTLREFFAVHLERVVAESQELRAHVERMERELQELRAQNERLRRQLRERSGPVREREIEIREQREFDRPQEGGIREERDLRRDREERIEIELRREGRDLPRDREENRDTRRRRVERDMPRENREQEEGGIQRDRDQGKEPATSRR